MPLLLLVATGACDRLLPYVIPGRVPLSGDRGGMPRYEFSLAEGQVRYRVHAAFFATGIRIGGELVSTARVPLRFDLGKLVLVDPGGRRESPARVVLLDSGTVHPGAPPPFSLRQQKKLGPGELVITIHSGQVATFEHLFTVDWPSFTFANHGLEVGGTRFPVVVGFQRGS